MKRTQADCSAASAGHSLGTCVALGAVGGRLHVGALSILHVLRRLNTLRATGHHRAALSVPLPASSCGREALTRAHCDRQIPRLTHPAGVIHLCSRKQCSPAGKQAVGALQGAMAAVTPEWKEAAVSCGSSFHRSGFEPLLASATAAHRFCSRRRTSLRAPTAG